MLLVTALISANGGADDNRGQRNDHGNNQCGDLGGVTFQIRLDYSTFSAYEVVQLHGDGTTTSIDNTENGFSPQAGVEAQPYSAQLGEWKCLGRNRVEIRTANYNYQVAGSSTPSTLAINYVVLNWAKNSDSAQGTFRFAYFALGSFLTNTKAQPLPGKSFGPYPVIGRRLCFFKL
ncbi:unnamed protein product [Rotaria sp. Silwood2]|nr:unnamed protein product [Rotaria sp. Silwood2]CAF4419822.1 unnamed protein product [Rotaria sp. Silwood2]